MVEKIQQQQQDQKEDINKNRSIDKIINSLKTIEGDGFIVNRSFPTNSISYIDPFLLLDEMGPMDFKPGEAKGAPDHPHRGFETVTYLIEGVFEHRDSSGNSGRLPRILDARCGNRCNRHAPIRRQSIAEHRLSSAGWLHYWC